MEHKFYGLGLTFHGMEHSTYQHQGNQLHRFRSQGNVETEGEPLLKLNGVFAVVVEDGIVETRIQVEFSVEVFINGKGEGVLPIKLHLLVVSEIVKARCP